MRRTASSAGRTARFWEESASHEMRVLPTRADQTVHPTETLLQYRFVGGLIGVRVFDADGDGVLAGGGVDGQIVVELK